MALAIDIVLVIATLSLHSSYFYFFIMNNRRIEELRSIVNDGTHNSLCIQDFEKYDVPKIKLNPCCDFFWMCRKNGTSLLLFSEILDFKYWESVESRRFALFRDMYAPISTFKFYDECGDSSVKYYCWSEGKLKQVDFEYIRINFHKMFIDIMCTLSVKYHEEESQCFKPLDIVYASDSTHDEMRKSLKFAESMGDTSLKDCVDRLSRYQRFALDHTIQIYKDFSEHGFTFNEVVNGKSKMVGGIIYHKGLPGGQWCIHT